MAVAKTWGAAAAKNMKVSFPSCDLCNLPGHEPARAQWGCDRPASEPVFSTSCGGCYGDGCSSCDEGKIQHYQCPTALTRKAPAWLGELFQAYSVFDAHGVMPVAGGWLDQTAHFQEAVAIFNNERGVYEKAEAQAREKPTKRPPPKRRD